MNEIREELGVQQRKPPVGARTRWAGIIPMISWVNENHQALMEYNTRHPKDCATPEDRSAYDDYMLIDEDWDVISQLVGVLQAYYYSLKLNLFSPTGGTPFTISSIHPSDGADFKTHVFSSTSCGWEVDFHVRRG